MFEKIYFKIFSPILIFMIASMFLSLVLAAILSFVAPGAIEAVSSTIWITIGIWVLYLMTGLVYIGFFRKRPHDQPVNNGS